MFTSYALPLSIYEAVGSFASRGQSLRNRGKHCLSVIKIEGVESICSRCVYHRDQHAILWVVATLPVDELAELIELQPPALLASEEPANYMALLHIRFNLRKP